MGGATSFVNIDICTINDKYFFLKSRWLYYSLMTNTLWVLDHSTIPRSMALSFHHLSSCWAVYSLAASGLAGSSSPLEIAVIWLLPSSIYFYKKRTMECISTSIPKFFPFINNSYWEDPALWLIWLQNISSTGIFHLTGPWASKLAHAKNLELKHVLDLNFE